MKKKQHTIITNHDYKRLCKTRKILLGSKDLDLNVENHICIVLANQEQNMSNLGLQAMLKSGYFKIKVQLSAKKGSVILPCSIDRELGLID